MERVIKDLRDITQYAESAISAIERKRPAQLVAALNSIENALWRIYKDIEEPDNA